MPHESYILRGKYHLVSFCSPSLTTCNFTEVHKRTPEIPGVKCSWSGNSLRCTAMMSENMIPEGCRCSGIGRGNPTWFETVSEASRSTWSFLINN